MSPKLRYESVIHRINRKELNKIKVVGYNRMDRSS